MGMSGEEVLISFKGDASGLLGAFQQIGDKASGMKGTLLGIGAGALVIGAIGVAAVKMAGDFQQSMTALVTGANESESNLKMVSDGVLALAVQTGTSTAQLSAGLYMIESAGFHGAAGLSVLKAAAEGAKVDSADLGTVADAVTSALNSYALGGDKAAFATNVLIATVAAGKMHMQDLASSLGSILPVASKAGISIQEVGAAIATMTMMGTPAAQATTYLRQMLVNLEAPGAKAVKTLAEIGLSSTQVALDMRKQPDGMINTLEEISVALAQKFPGSAAIANAEFARVKAGTETVDQAMAHLATNTSPQYVGALKDIAGGSKNMMAMMELTGPELGVFRGNLTSITDAANKGGASITGFARVQGDFNFKVDQAKAAVEVFMITLGTALLPVLTNIVGGIAPIIAGFTAWENHTHTLQNVFLFLIGAISGMVTVLADVIGFFARNQVAMDLLVGVLAAIGLQILSVVVPAMIAWAISTIGVAAGMIAACWPGLLLLAAIAVAVALVILIVQHWGQIMSFVGAIIGDVGRFIGGVFSAIGTWAHNVFGTMGAYIGGVFSAIGTFAHSIWTGILGFLQGVWNVIVTIAKVYFTILFIIVAGPFLLIWHFLQPHWAMIVAFLTGVWNGIKATATTIFTAISTFFTTIFTAIAKFFTTIWETITSALTAAWNTIKGAATTAWNAISTVITNFVVGEWKGIVAIWNTVSSFLSGLWNGIKGIASSLWNAISGVIMGPITTLKGLLTTAWNDISTGFSNAMNGIKGIATSIWNDISGIFKNAVNFVIGIINGFIRGIDSISIDVPGVGHVGFNVGQIPYLAAGGFAGQGGLVGVGERGPETMFMPGGATVFPLPMSQLTGGGSSSGGNAQLASAIANLATVIAAQNMPGNSPVGAPPVGTGYGAVTQHFGSVNFNGVNNLQALHRAFNALAGFSQEAGNRGAVNGTY